MVEKNLQRFLYDIKQGKPLYLSIDRTESENGLEEIVLENVQHVRVSILTEQLIEYDIEMISTEPVTNFMNNYRPYFVSFIVPLEEGIIQAIETLGSDWYNG